MTYDQLKANYSVAYRIIIRERAMRDKVFAANLEKRQEKIAEMDKLLIILDGMKDELKKHIGPSAEQPPLLDIPRKVEYR